MSALKEIKKVEKIEANETFTPESCTSRSGSPVVVAATER